VRKNFMLVTVRGGQGLALSVKMARHRQPADRRSVRVRIRAPDPACFFGGLLGECLIDG